LSLAKRMDEFHQMAEGEPSAELPESHLAETIEEI
jgi:hypothetical protein